MKHNEDINLVINSVDIGNKRIVISWSADIGFGQLTIATNNAKDNLLGELAEKEEYLIDTECLGKDFYEKVLNKAMIYLIENSKIIS